MRKPVYRIVWIGQVFHYMTRYIFTTDFMEYKEFPTHMIFRYRMPPEFPSGSYETKQTA